METKLFEDIFPEELSKRGKGMQGKRISNGIDKTHIIIKINLFRMKHSVKRLLFRCFTS